MKTTHKKYRIYIIGIIVVFLIVTAWILTYFQLKDLKPIDRGTFGDMFGSVNSIFSGLALVGIIFTIILQKNELTLQREELKETRREFQIQNKTLKNQRFENTFFNLLNLHHQIVNGIDVDIQTVIEKPNRSAFSINPDDIKQVTVKGRDVFKEKYEILKEELLAENKDLNDDELNYAYHRIYITVQTDFGHYFRNLYRIIKFVDSTEFISLKELKIDNNETTSKEKAILYGAANYDIRYQYTSMVRAQLSDFELLWLFYNCLSKKGVEKFKPYIERYSLLKNMPKEELHSYDFKGRYADKAYSNNK